jgi:DNA replication protein
MVDSAMLRDKLKDAEQEYPPEWIAEAIGLAVQMNKRNWRYIEAILKRWRTEGKQDEFTKRYAERDGEEYLTGEYARFIKR